MVAAVVEKEEDIQYNTIQYVPIDKVGLGRAAVCGSSMWDVLVVYADGVSQVPRESGAESGAIWRVRRAVGRVSCEDVDSQAEDGEIRSRSGWGVRYDAQMLVAVVGMAVGMRLAVEVVIVS